jgi:DNA-binding FrmR family transcriptional regulator
MELGLRIPSTSSGSDAPRAICATITMIEAGRFCLEVAQQLHAVEKAIAEAKRTLIHDHVDHCLKAALDQGKRRQRTTVEEFRAITRYL